METFKSAMCLALTVLMCSLSAVANDSEFYGSGEQLRPLKNTTVRMVREDLAFTFARSRDSNQTQEFDVAVDYVFRNDGPAATLTVGFVCPPTSQDEYDEGASNSPITDIVVSVNGKSVKVKHTEIRKEGMMDGLHVHEGDHVYLFNATFARGRNVVRHRYSHLASNSIYFVQELTYRLLTGGNWAGGVIDTFNLHIDLGRRGNQALIIVPALLSESPAPSQWTIVRPDDDSGARPSVDTSIGPNIKPGTSQGVNVEEPLGAIIDTICERDLWFDYENAQATDPCLGKEFAVMIVPEGRLEYREVSFVPARDVRLMIANESWLRERTERLRGPLPLIEH